MALHLQKYLDAQAFSGKARLAIERMFTAFLGEILTAGSGVTVTYDDETGEFEFGAAGGGGSSVIGASFDGQGAPIAVDTYCDIYVPFDCTITGVVMLAEQVGAIVVDVWADTYGNYPPTNADSICAADHCGCEQVHRHHAHGLDNCRRGGDHAALQRRVGLPD
jgi:hypothetical protein